MPIPSKEPFSTIRMNMLVMITGFSKTFVICNRETVCSLIDLNIVKHFTVILRDIPMYECFIDVLSERYPVHIFCEKQRVSFVSMPSISAPASSAKSSMRISRISDPKDSIRILAE